MKNNYYNTNNETGTALAGSNAKASTQEKLIMEIYLAKKELSASDAWKLYDAKGMTPITSIRRAITNLTKEGKLYKTAKMTNGLYGKKEHIYSVYNEELNTVQL